MATVEKTILTLSIVFIKNKDGAIMKIVVKIIYIKLDIKNKKVIIKIEISK